MRHDYAKKLRALLEGLECENINILLKKSPLTLRAVGQEIAKAAKFGAPIYRMQQRATPSPYDCGGNPTKDYPGE